MAVITGSIASGFPTATNVGATSTVAASTQLVTNTDDSTAASTRVDSRLSGVGLHLGAAEMKGATSHQDLFATLRSALDGFSAQTGFDQLLVQQLIAA